MPFVQKQQTQIAKNNFSVQQMISSIETLSDERATLLQILTCLICQQQASEAHICPNCSKFFCFGCITQWIVDREKKCPYCTEALEKTHLVNCQNLFDELSNTIEAMKVVKTKKQKKCESHNLSLNYYCQDCEIEVCSDCCVLSSQHALHKFLKTSEAKKDFEKENTKLKHKMNNLKENIQKLLEFIKGKGSNFEQNFQIENKKFKQFIKNLKERTNKRFIAEITELQRIIESEKDIACRKNEYYEKTLNFMKNCSKIHFVSAEADNLQQKLIFHLQEITKSNSEIKRKMIKHQDTKIESEIYPEYQSKTFSLVNFSHLCYQNSIIYSDVLQTFGIQWCLKIYPCGNPQNEDQPQKEQSDTISSNNILDSYMSVFIQMKSSLRQKGKYRHKVIIENPSNPHKNIEREFESIFDRGESWGYEKFVKISHLYDGKFFCNENNELKITLMIAPSNYFEACQDLKKFTQIRKQLRNRLKVGKPQQKIQARQDSRDEMLETQIS